MFFDLNLPVFGGGQPGQHSKRGEHVYNATQLSAIESRLDILVHLGYTVVGFNQVVHKKIEKKTHVNTLDPLLKHLRPRPGVIFLKRLTIVLDEDSEKGFGLTNVNASLFAPYDLIALTPTTSTTFSVACLNHSLPTPLTAHIISLPLTHPRLPFNLKHTYVRTAIKNGAMFEFNYAGALGVDSPVENTSAGGTDGSVSIKRNWWAAAREVIRITKGKGFLVSSGVVNPANLRAPRDIANVITLLDVPQNLAHESLTTAPKTLVLRAQSRKTYRGMYSVTPASQTDKGSNPCQIELPNETVSNPISDKPRIIADINSVTSKRRSDDLPEDEERTGRPKKKKKKSHKGKERIDSGSK